MNKLIKLKMRRISVDDNTEEVTVDILLDTCSSHPDKFTLGQYECGAAGLEKLRNFNLN